MTSSVIDPYTPANALSGRRQDEAEHEHADAEEHEV